MRLLLLPISTRRALIYCEPLALKSTTSKPSLLDRVVIKANTTWAEWEKDTDSYLNWKKRTTNYGNMMFRRIPYEEWGLKSIPPLSRRVERVNASRKTATAPEERVEVQFPGLYQGLCKETVPQTIRRLTERQSLHQKRFWYSVLAMPLTIPVGLLPIIPNLPFFYLVFRAYSHWKAWSGSKHLTHILNTGLRLAPTIALDTVYTSGLLYPTRAASRDSPDPTLDQTRAVVECLRQQTNPDTPPSSVKSSSVSPAAPSALSSTSSASAKLLPGRGKKLHTGEEEVMLLQGWNGKLLAERLKLPGLQVEIERAVEQVQDSIHKDEGELLGEKKELEELTKKYRAKSKAAKTA